MDTTHDHTTAAPQLGSYQIDAGRSTVGFAIRHMFGLATVRGTFAIRSGTVDVAEPLTDSSVRAEIDAASFRTGNEQRDGNVRSARFLDAERHPEMTFSAGRMDGSILEGALTVRDVARPVQLSIERSEMSPGAFTARATTRIDRTEFGVTAQRGFVGRHLDVTLEIRCVRA